MVEVQKPMVFCDFYPARATLCGSRCKNPWFFAISAVLAQPSAGIGVVEVTTQGFLRLLLFELVLASCLVVRAPAPGTGGSRVRFLPGPRAGVARCNLHFTATCAEQLAQSKLHRATCADQLAPTSLRRAPCLEQLAQSNLRRATCTEQLAQSSLHRATCRARNLHRATCRDQLAGATCAEQLAQSNLHSATCVEQLAQTNLHRPVCAEHLAWCCLALASRSVGKKNASCSVGPTSLAMFCFRANRGLGNVESMLTRVVSALDERSTSTSGMSSCGRSCIFRQNKRSACYRTLSKANGTSNSTGESYLLDNSAEFTVVGHHGNRTSCC